MAENPLLVVAVEDNPELHELYRLFLESRGCRVDIYDTAAEAEPVLRRGDYNFLVSDLNLLGMNGVELIKRVKPRIFGRVGIIFSCSAPDFEPSQIAQMKEDGVDEVLPKDFGILERVVRGYSLRIREACSIPTQLRELAQIA